MSDSLHSVDILLQFRK